MKSLKARIRRKEFWPAAGDVVGTLLPAKFQVWSLAAILGCASRGSVNPLRLLASGYREGRGMAGAAGSEHSIMG